MSISGFVNRLPYRGPNMTDATVMEAGMETGSSGRSLARYSSGLCSTCCPSIDTLDYSARCRQRRNWAEIAMILCRSQRIAWHWRFGDASGKGLAAALMISNVQSSLRTAALFTGNDRAAVLGAVNRQVHASSLSERLRHIILWRF